LQVTPRERGRGCAAHANHVGVGEYEGRSIEEVAERSARKASRLERVCFTALASAWQSTTRAGYVSYAVEPARRKPHTGRRLFGVSTSPDGVCSPEVSATAEIAASRCRHGRCASAAAQPRRRAAMSRAGRPTGNGRNMRCGRMDEEERRCTCAFR